MALGVTGDAVLFLKAQPYICSGLFWWIGKQLGRVGLWPLPLDLPLGCETLPFLQSFEKSSSMLTIEVLPICPSDAKQREVFFLFHAEEKLPPVGSRYSKRFSQVFLLIPMTRQSISPEQTCYARNISFLTLDYSTVLLSRMVHHV